MQERRPPGVLVAGERKLVSVPQHPDDDRAEAGPRVEHHDGLARKRPGPGRSKESETSIDRMRSVHAVPNLAKSLIVVARRAFRPLQQARLCCKDSFHSTDLLAVSERAAEANLHASGRKPRLRRSMGWPILDDHVY